MDPTQTLELAQALKLSPTLLQSMNILQMTTLELSAYLKDLALENPVLEEQAGGALPGRSFPIRCPGWPTSRGQAVGRPSVSRGGPTGRRALCPFYWRNSWIGCGWRRNCWRCAAIWWACWTTGAGWTRRT